MTTFLFLLSVLISCSNSTTINAKLSLTFAQDYFNGNWRMTGYGCDGKQPKVELMKAHTEGKLFIATKTLGDNCVTTGTETFRGTLPDQLETGKNIAITYVVGSAKKPNSGHWKNSLHILDDDHFASQGRHYYRDTEKNAAEAPKPAAVPAAAVPAATAPVVPAPVVPAPAIPAIPATAGAKIYYYHNFFLGNWNAIGYVCDGKGPKMETVNIKYESAQYLNAIKVIGDACVPAGKLSFKGDMPAILNQGAKFNVDFFIGVPGIAANRKEIRSLQIVDLNTFQIGNHTYYRVMGPGNSAPNGVYLNMTPLLGKSSYIGAGYVKLNPKRNMRHPVRRFTIIEEETNKPGNC